jgi:RNA polymerase sigma-70 factor, ECF subfamily
MDHSLRYPAPQATGAGERTLVQRATAGDREAFAELYDRFVERIYRYIYYKIGCKADAQDLTAQVFLKALEAIGNYRWTGRPFDAWLYRIAHNAIVDYYRTRRETWPLDEMTAGEEPRDQLDQVTRQQWTVEVLQRALLHLTDQQQEVVILRFLEGYSVGEVAQVMGRKPGAIRTLQYRALTRMGRMLQPDSEFSASGSDSR